MSSTMNLKFEKIYEEELYEVTRFGPLQGDQFRSMKEYMLHHLANLITTVQNKDLNNEQTFKTQKEYAESLRNIVMEDLHPSLRKLQQADQRRLQSIQECEEIITKVQVTATSNSDSLVQVLNALELKKG